MTKWMIRLLVFAMLPLPLGCSSTQITTSWVNPKYKQRTLESVLVIGVSDDATSIRLFEDKFVARLKLEGVAASAGYAQLPSDRKPERADIDAAIAAVNAKSVLITRVTGISERTQFDPPSDLYYPRYYRGLYGYYEVGYGDVYTPGYYTSYDVYRLVTNLYDSETASLMWTAESETMDPDNIELAIDELVEALVGDIKNKGLL